MATEIHTRREFLHHGLGIVGVGAAVPNFLIQSAFAGPKARSDERIVVALLLTGGHDGLSDVPPYADEQYYRCRKATRIEENEVIKLNGEVGLHPNLTGFRDLLDERAFAVVLGTGYPNFDLSHFVSRDIWEAAQPGQTTGKSGAMGWLGRYLDYTFRDNPDPKLALAVNPGRLPLVITGDGHPGIALDTPDSFRFLGEPSAEGQSLYHKLHEMTPHQPGYPDLQFVTQTAVHANASSSAILDLLRDEELGSNYPDTHFGSSLRTIATLIGKGLSTRIYYAAQGIAVFGGYDTHAEQKPRHSQLMDELCRSVCAFYKDLKRQGNAERVLTFTFSEFGRRVPENYSGGTDHGLAQPMFLFGPMVHPGVHGMQPSLKELDENGNLKMMVDFRRVYASILEKWLKVPSEPVLGGKYSPVDCLAG